MGKPRVRGQHNTVYIEGTGGNKIKVGEITKMSVKELGELKKNRGLGEAGITANKTFEGYDLSFEGGMVDWTLSALLHKQDEQIYSGERAPYFTVVQKIEFYGNNKIVTDTYNNVIFHGYNLDVDSMDESMQKWEGFSGIKKTRQEDSGITTEASASENSIKDLITYTLENRDSASN